MFGLGPTELIIVFLIILLVFGAKRIPEIAQGLGKGIMEFRKAARDITKEFDVNNSPTQFTKNELKSQKDTDINQQSPGKTQKTDTSQG